MKPCFSAQRPVHALQRLGPVLALGAAGAEIDLEIGVVRVGLAGEQALDLAARGLGLDLADGGLAFPDAGRVALGVAELDQRQGILEVLLEPPGWRRSGPRARSARA